MKQIEATQQRPFYSVSYQYERNPWASFSCNRFGKGRTMQGTDDLQLAVKVADRCVTESGIKYAWVFKSTDCYNHSVIYKAIAKATQPEGGR